MSLFKQATTDGTDEKRKTTDMFESDQATTDETDEKRKSTDMFEDSSTYVWTTTIWVLQTHAIFDQSVLKQNVNTLPLQSLIITNALEDFNDYQNVV